MSTRAQTAGRAPRVRSGRPVARRKPAARRNPGRSSGRIQWDRLGRIVLVLVIIGLFASYVSPLLNLARTYRQTSVSKADLHLVQAEHAQLQRQVTHVRSGAVLRREARKLGMVLPGEQAYVVNGVSHK